MDVYVATSMRERHEYLFVNDITSKVFRHPRLLHLKLRWFDPTQAFCHDRIDKGLSEALMLKRAKCTLYLAQESDTLGKDSELASTLAQGKPVIAFVPSVENEAAYVEALIQTIARVQSGKSESEIVRDQLGVFAPKLAWEDPSIRAWLDSGENAPSLADIKLVLGRQIRSHYDKRARALKEQHPLGIQINLVDGVANGVLVVRTIEDCANLIYRVLTHRLQFQLEPTQVDGKTYLVLRETISGSVFRVVTGDAMLTNAFWNFFFVS
jgi:hypothetical protein